MKTYLNMLNDKEIQKVRKLINDTDHGSAVAFKALSDVNRYRIFRILADQSELSVTDIAKILGISKPLTSMHLKVLLHAQFLQKEKVGKKVFLRLEPSNPFVQAIVETIKKTSKKVFK